MDTHVPASDSSAEAAAAPVPDEVATPSITGARTKLFRTRPGAHRSRHPTRAVSGIGRLADALLGAGLESCALIHHAEDEIPPDRSLHPPEKTRNSICRWRDGGEHPVLTRRPVRFAQFAGRLEARRALWLEARRALWLEAHRALRRAVFAGAPSLCFAAADREAVVRARLGVRPDGIIVPEKAVPG